ncbi:gamma carbonic anhydrase family protein [Streptomyces sp. NPDC055681]
MAIYEIDGVVPVVHPTAFVHPQASLIGDVLIGPRCYIGPMASLRGDFGRINVGEGSNVQDGCVLHAFPGADAVLDIGSHIGHGAILHGCHISTEVLVGMNAVVMDGVDIGARSLIAANSFVPAGMVIPDESLVVGSPARVVRPLDADVLRWKSDGVRIYQELAERSLATLREVAPLEAAEPDRRRVSTGREVSIPLHERREGRT